MSEWLFDLGNSRLKCAPLRDDGTPGEVRALGHDEDRFVAALDAVLPAHGGCAYIASVASPALTVAVLDALTARFDRISLARTQPSLAGVHIAYAQPAKLGVDRFLAMLAAHARGPAHGVPSKDASPWLIAGVGTALTIDLLDGAGRHRGGRIAPSPALMRRALHEAAAQLPEIGGAFGEFAADTEDALASGCEGAALALIERSLHEGERLLGARPRLLLHGGGADALRGHFPQTVWEPSLVLHGLATWARVGRG